MAREPLTIRVAAANGVDAKGEPPEVVGTTIEIRPTTEGIDFYGDANRIVDALAWNLPGGTMDRILVLMLNRRVSQLVVRDPSPSREEEPSHRREQSQSRYWENFYGAQVLAYNAVVHDLREKAGEAFAAKNDEAATVIRKMADEIETFRLIPSQERREEARKNREKDHR